MQRAAVENVLGAATALDPAFRRERHEVFELVRARIIQRGLAAEPARAGGLTSADVGPVLGGRSPESLCPRVAGAAASDLALMMWNGSGRTPRGSEMERRRAGGGASGQGALEGAMRSCESVGSEAL